MARVKGSWDQARFERLFTDHFDAVMAYAVARADAETAQDAVADAFFVAWRRLDEVPDPARAWLLGVTRKTLATQRRSRARQEAVTQRMRSGQARVFTSAEDTPLVDAEAARVALDQLSEGDRELLCLLAWDGVSQREAAQVLGCSFGAFRVRYVRARRRFRSALAQAGQPSSASARVTQIRNVDTEEKTA
jgi:RNA polymerase sigma-70 factor (ECF subfamily)